MTSSNTFRRHLARAAALTVPAATLISVLGAPAHAGLIAPPTTAPQMALTILDIHGVGFHVCGSGNTTAVADYTLDITVARSNGTTDTLHAEHRGSSWTTGNCLDVTENLTTSGQFQVVFRISASAATRAAVALGGGTWDFAGEQSWDTA